jgi:hypothetical protein
LLERIRALEPGFDPRDLPPPSAPLPEIRVTDAQRDALGMAAGLAPGVQPPASPLARAGEIASPAGGRALRAALPDEVYHATRSRDQSLLVVIALALSSDEPTRRKQLALVEAQLGASRAALCLRLYTDLAPTSSQLRLPVLELALPALRQRPREQLTYLREMLARIQELEPTPRLFDFVLLRVLEAYLRGLPGAEPAVRRAARALEPRAAVRALLGNVAAFGNQDTQGAKLAYEAGITALGWRLEARDPTFEPLTASRNLGDLDAALTALATIRPRDKERLLRGVIAAVRADAVTATEERELFRLIATSLDCPLPPDVDL